MVETAAKLFRCFLYVGVTFLVSRILLGSVTLALILFDSYRHIIQLKGVMVLIS